MNAPFDPVSFIRRLEAEGIARGAAEAIAQGIEDRNRELATTGDIDRLARKIDKLAANLDKLAANLDQFATKSELEHLATKAQLDAAMSKVIIQVGGMLAGSIALIVTILGTIIALR